MPLTHENLAQLLDHLVRPEDYFPYGNNRDREGDEWGKQGSDPSDPAEYRGDCSCGCRWYAALAKPLGGDWGVCCNLASHRCGLLTFEHQGCPQCEIDPVDVEQWEEDVRSQRQTFPLEHPTVWRRIQRRRTQKQRSEPE